MGIERYAARDIRAAKGKITDEQIFLSNGYRDLLRTVAVGATKEFSGYTYNVKVIPHAKYAAISCADTLTRTISINLSNDFIKQTETRDKKHEVILGILLHEIGHLLYTDFGELETAIANLKNGKLLYEDIRNEALVNLLSGGKRLRMMLIKIYKKYSNRVEDGYIENRLLDTFPGYGECLLTLRNMQMNGDAENMKKESKDDACLSDLMNLTLEYAKYGIDYSEYKSETAQEYFAKLKPLIDKALITDNRLKRNKLYAKGLLVFAEYLEKLSDEMQDKESDSMPSSPEDSTERSGEATRGDAADTDPDDGSEGKDDKKSSASDTDEIAGSLENPGSADDNSSSDAEKGDPEDDAEDADSQNEEDDAAQGNETEDSETGENDGADEEDFGNTEDGTESDAEGETSDENAEKKAGEDSGESSENQDDSASESDDTESAKADLDGSEPEDKEPQIENANDNDGEMNGIDKDACDNDPEDIDSDNSKEPSSDSAADGEEDDASSDNVEDTDSLKDSNSFDESATDGDANDEYGDDDTTEAEKEDKDADEVESTEDTSCTKDTDNQPKRPESYIVPPELERLENKIAEDICKAEGHALVLKQMVKAAERGKKARREYGFDSGRGCRCSIMEQTDDGQERYLTTHVNLDRIAGRTAKALERVIKEREIDGYTNEQYEGAYLDMSNLYRSDKRILQDKNVPEGRPDMEAIVLVDCSGSMDNGSRMENARNCAYITWKFCQGIGIPCSVYGHTTTLDGPEPLTLYCAAHKTDKKEKGERILSLEAFSDNVDDFAIRACAELLKDSRAKKKFLLIISDGVPMADNGYRGIHADNMTRWAVEDAKRAGIGVITAGLGASCKDVKTVYVETGTQRSKHRARFLDCTDVNLLPKAFVKVLKEEIL